MTTWVVPARVTRVIDGDTFVCDLDLGWGLWKIGARVRLAGVDCPEMDTDAGKAAREFVLTLMDLRGAMVGMPQVIIRSQTLDKYGRTLGFVQLANGQDLASALVGAGHAKVVL